MTPPALAVRRSRDHAVIAPLRTDTLNLNKPTVWPIGTAPSQEFCDEDQRLVVLASFNPEALSGDPELARLTRFAAQLCNAPSAAVSLVEEEEQRFIASSGMTDEATDRSTSFCAQTMLGTEVLEVMDATNDPRFAEFELVQGDAKIRYYAGAPLISPEGAPLGALCINDTEIRAEPLSDTQREGLIVLAEAVMRRLQSHRLASETERELQASNDRLQFMLDSVPDIAWSAANGPEFDYFNARFHEVTEQPAPEGIEDWRKLIHPDDFESSRVKFEHAMQTATMFEDEWRLRISDGSYRWVISRAVPSSEDPATARWFGTLTDIHDRYKISEERELLAGELAHRIKNIFSVITGLIALNSRGDATLKVFADTLTQNVQALARAQEFALRLGNQTEGDLKSLMKVLMAPYGLPGESAVHISGDEIETGPRAATPLALVFHELATNSAKYGALSVADGRVEIHVSLQDDCAQITWEERGGPVSKAPTETGFGSRLVRMAIENQLGGKIEQDWREEGLAAQISIPRQRLEL